MDNHVYQPIIGLEVHVELQTKSKMFCGCPANHFGREPNTITCPVCLGLPGALPVPNKKAVEWTMMLGLALNCQIPLESKFDRKNYFYPDLPKGYQISQYDMPLCMNGKLKVRGGETREIRIRRVHLEEDTGKLQHAMVDGKKVTLVDFNRSGVPLAEIVTEPDFSTIDEVDLFLKKLRKIIRYLKISDADMEKGSMRLEPSISIRDQLATTLPNYRVELKNINSFKFVRKALEAELMRQMQNPKERYQATRRYNEKTSMTEAMRYKEEAHDYRYFPEPDIPPMRWNTQFIDELKRKLPELPDTVIKQLMEQYKLDQYNATQLSETLEQVNLFKESVRLAQKGAYKEANISPKMLASWFINRKQELIGKSAAQIVQRIASSVVLKPILEAELVKLIQKVISENPKAVEDYRKGKEQALMFLVGKAMGVLKGKASPAEIREKIILLLQ